MLAILLLDHRLAFVFLSALILGAAVPLAIAWTRILPEEAPPFEMGKAASAPAPLKTKGVADVPWGDMPRRSRFAIVLLTAVSLGFILQLPGLPFYGAFHPVLDGLPQSIDDWIELAPAFFFLAVPAGAVAHAFLKPNLLSLPLIVAGVLVLLLWLLSPALQAALIS